MQVGSEPCLYFHWKPIFGDSQQHGFMAKPTMQYAGRYGRIYRVDVDKPGRFDRPLQKYSVCSAHP